MHEHCALWHTYLSQIDIEIANDSHQHTHNDHNGSEYNCSARCPKRLFSLDVSVSQISVNKLCK
uniref:Uncharacterized protein n=1 Tax=Parascaris equorum TaxID=6256 RepID=A0A914RAR6_PAREQ